MEILASIDFTSSLAALWADLAVWLKALMWLAGISLTAAAIVASVPISWPAWAVFGAAGVGAYAFNDLFFDVDSFATDYADYEQSGDPHRGIDVIEEGINLVSPVDPIFETVTGTQLPGSGGEGGMVDQTIDDIRRHNKKLEDLQKELDQ